MNAKNLSQLKNELQEGSEFLIVNHYLRPEFIGQIRRVTKRQTNGLYSNSPYEPASEKINQGNGGLGFWLPFPKANELVFNNDNTITILFENGEPLMTIK